MAKARVAFALAAVAAAFAATAGGADAGLLGCRYPAASQVFASFGDASRYVPIPGGNFESSSGWSLSGGAAIVAGNEPFYLGSSGDSHSLLLPPGSSATTPAICLQVLTPSFRFVGQASGASSVHVTLYTRTLLGLLMLPFSADVAVGSTWAPSAKQEIDLENVLGLLNLGSDDLYLRFTPNGGSTVQLDDLYLDPFLWD